MVAWLKPSADFVKRFNIFKYVYRWQARGLSHLCVKLNSRENAASETSSAAVHVYMHVYTKAA